jgi:hypothetical protein
MSLESLVEQITGDLNDSESGHENITWAASQIRVWIGEGISLVYDKRPDLFMERVIFEVDNCSIIQSSCECDTVRRVIGQVTEGGRLIRTLRQRGLEISFEWTGVPCRPKHVPGQTEFKLESYAVDTMSDTLYIWPEVPLGMQAWVEVECSHRPSQDELASDGYEIPSGALVAAKQWALWRAKSMDMEISGAASSAAQLHYRAFFEALGLSAETTTVIHKREKD